MQLKSRSHDAPDMAAAMELCYAKGWTDGLPVIPPVIDRVDATLAFEGRPPEEESAWQHMLRHGNPYGFITPVQELKLGTEFETASIPDTFLVSLDGPVSGMSSDAAVFFGTGGSGHPDGLHRPIPSELENVTAKAGMLLERSFELAPGESRTLHFLYGYLPEGTSLKP